MSHVAFRSTSLAATLSFLAAGFLAIGSPRTLGSQAAGTAPNTLTSAEKAAGWTLLFDGKTTNGWRGYHMQSMPPAWKVVDGVLTKSGPTEDIVTTKTFGDFELMVDWMLGPTGNSGIFYRGTEKYDRVYWSTPEYQLLDDSLAADGRSRLTSAGAVYGFYPAPKGVAKFANNWNTARIVVKGSHVEHWMNGVKLAEYEFWSPDFTAKFKASKFKDSTEFGRATSGVIAIQGDHNGGLSLRNIKIRVLK